MTKLLSYMKPVFLGTVLAAFFGFSAGSAFAASVPSFQVMIHNGSYTLMGRDPAHAGTLTVPTVVVPISLSFESEKHATRPVSLDATHDVSALLHSPVFTPVSFPGKGTLQFGDALLRATFPRTDSHMILAAPEVMKTIEILVPSGYGYALRSRSTDRTMGIADLEYVQRELFKQIPRQNNRLVIALTRNAAYYAEGDATICCLWGTHGVDSATGNSFVLASYLSETPSAVRDQDVQPLTEQLTEFIYDPLHDPLLHVETHKPSGNEFPAWFRPATMDPGDEGKCGGTGIASAYFLLEPTDTNHKNNFPYSSPFTLGSGPDVYHVQNVALLQWYTGSSGEQKGPYSFPDAELLREPATPCPAGRGNRKSADGTGGKMAEARPRGSRSNGQALIGYWTGNGRDGHRLRLRDVSAQWDIIIVAFATPAQNSPEGTLVFQPPQGISPDEFKIDVADLKRQGRKVLLSLGGGGEYFVLDKQSSIPTFVSCVSRIVKQYGFDGVDIDFESPSLVLAPGDAEFRHPTTPSIVNLIAGLRQLRSDLGPAFMISLVPEGPQILAGHLTYGGQFGSYLPLAYGLRDILSFMDVQDYNTPPLEGLDGEIYQAGSVDYHAAMTELVLSGFTVAGDPASVFPALPQKQVAVGFLVGETTPEVVSDAMNVLIGGHATTRATYRLRNPAGYPHMLGAMFWNIDDDLREGLSFSNLVGPELHSFRSGN